MSSVGTNESAVAVGISFPIIDGILVGLRFFTRRYTKSDLQIDDWLCIPAWLSLTGCCAALLAGVFKGAFEPATIHDPAHRTEHERVIAQVTAALVILWMGANFCVKLIMLFFYRRIFVGRRFNIFNKGLIGLSVVWFIFAVASWLFYCGTNFEPNVEGGWAICPTWGFKIQLGVFVLDSFIDFCLLVLPIPFVWRLQLDLKRKLSITIIFILGGFAFVAGLNNTIIQLVYLTEPSLIESGGGANFFQGSSILFSNWPAIEIGVGLLASNLPHLSFRVGRSIGNALPAAIRISLDSLRHAAAAISLSSLRRFSPHATSNASRDHPYTATSDSAPPWRHDADAERRWEGAAHKTDSIEQVSEVETSQSIELVDRQAHDRDVSTEV
ncbi:hypothetical protein F4859DRAFT_45436 [Xylaria cf. heliscus]|nr:hypothetical protein F4859DRAFT_45436 [Xylaria cf. heliscus]